MDNREAKFILSAYRARGQDAGDPRFSEALAQAKRDPLLERWFRDSISFDAAVAAKFSATAVPTELRENILAGGKMSRFSRRRNGFRRRAIAAAFIAAAIFGTLIVRERQQPKPARWQEEALTTISSLVSGHSQFEAQSQRARELAGWLAANHAPAPLRFPASLQTLDSIGCKTFFVDGSPVSVICFQRADGGLIHLVVANAFVASDRAIDGKTELIGQGNWATATWREGDMVYMLALEGSRDQLRPYVL